MNVRILALPLVISSFLVCAVGCSNKNTQPAQTPQASNGVTTTSATTSNGNVHLSDDIMKSCKIDFNSVANAPKFDTDETALLPQDRTVLQQVATCLTTGPLKGRQVTLVGRADPRGETEYNMTLGEHRADAAKNYLANLGVDKTKMGETSRGKLDATGTDAAGWERDRRVDILLK